MNVKQPVQWMLGITAVAASAGIAYALLAPPRFDAVHPVRGPAVQAVYATGNVEPTIMLPVAARTTARLVELNVDEGATVTRGELLARLEDADLTNTLAALRSQETLARQVYERDEKLIALDSISHQAYDQAKSDWEAAKANAASAAAQAGFMKLTAPADGRIIKRDGEIGELIPVNQPVFWLAVKSRLRISAEVDEEDIPRIAPGQKVVIRTDAFPGQIFHGTVQSVTPKGDTTARSYRVRIALPDDTPLMIGMTTETNVIVRESGDALLVPTTALQADKIWKIVDGHLVAQPVTVGAKGADQTEILSGVGADDVILKTADSTLTAGKRARARIVTDRP